MNRDPDNLASESRSAIDWAREAGLGGELAQDIRREVRRRRRARYTAIATGVAMLVLGGLFWTWNPAPTATAPATVASANVSLPERRSLADGSIVELRKGAELRVEFTELERRVMLVRGEAFFQVAKNPARPFIVAANGVEVRAVGTAFAVQVASTAVEILVSEGRVAVDRATPSPGPGRPALSSVFLDAGHRTTVEISAPAPAAPPVMSVTDDDLAQRLGWRVPRLEFSGTPLSEVVNLFQRHGRVRLTLGSPDLETVRVSGVLRADNVEALLRLLAADHGIVADHRGEEIVLRHSR